ncbi:DM13 domain-containing protein [Micromonospora sp. MP36]|nr:DM13 domain-containing protein [Micromonospora sp. MP36]
MIPGSTDTVRSANAVTRPPYVLVSDSVASSVTTPSVGSGSRCGYRETLGDAPDSTVRSVRVPGRHRLELAGPGTSNGPDLQVWLTDQPVRTGPSGWHALDDGRPVALGPLKGNREDQAYEIPAETDLTGLTSVASWGWRLALSFGAAPLSPAG